MIQNIINGQDVSERFNRFLARYTACSRINNNCIGCAILEQCTKYYDSACEGYPNQIVTQITYENVKPPLMTKYEIRNCRRCFKTQRRKVV